MANDDKIDVLSLFFGALLFSASLVFGIFIGQVIGNSDRRSFEREAIRNGAATYVIESDEEVFRWLTNGGGIRGND